MDKVFAGLLLGGLVLALGAAFSIVLKEAFRVDVGRVPAALLAASIFATLVASVVGSVRIIYG